LSAANMVFRSSTDHQERETGLLLGSNNQHFARLLL